MSTYTWKDFLNDNKTTNYEGYIKMLDESYAQGTKKTNLDNIFYDILKPMSEADTQPYYTLKNPHNPKLSLNLKYSRYVDIDTNKRTTIDNKTTTNGPRDKFNANYISLDPNYSNTQYIAATCPKTPEVMQALIAQEKINHVVMVTGIEEKGRQKCTNYFDKDKRLLNTIKLNIIN